MPITVDSPVRCKIYLKYKVLQSSSTETKTHETKMKELMLTQVFNYKISENKRPIYGFNKLDYSQVVRGKRLFEGVIAVKKSIISDISKIIGLADATSTDNLNYSKKKVEYLQNVIENNSSIKSKLDEYYERALKEYEAQQQAYLNNDTMDILNDMPEGTGIVLAFGDNMDSDDLKEQYQELVARDMDLTAEQLELLIRNNADFVIEDVNFYERTGEINISKNDIDDVYRFFGKLKIWGDA